jgi:hypothetical protein
MICALTRQARIESLYRLSHPDPRASRYLRGTRPHIEHSATLQRFFRQPCQLNWLICVAVTVRRLASGLVCSQLHYPLKCHHVLV